MRSIWLIFGLLLGVCGCKGKAVADRSCVEQPCEAAPTTNPCQCDPGLICEAGSCQPCTDASQCETGICHPSGRCEQQPCALDEHCPIAEICDGGQCVHAPRDEGEQGLCGIAAIYFAPDSAKLTPNNQERLMTAAPCLIDALTAGATLLVEGYDDELGGEQYSHSSSERRAASVRDFLIGVGLPAEQIRVIGKGSAEARGHDQPSRASDRRVQLVVER